jgi:hypothetical protein
MFELHVVVAGIVIFNIMELIMKIVHNYPTETVHVRVCCTDQRSLKNSAVLFIDFERYRVLLGLLFGPLTVDAEGENKGSVVARRNTHIEEKHTVVFIFVLLPR